MNLWSWHFRYYSSGRTDWFLICTRSNVVTRLISTPYCYQVSSAVWFPSSGARRRDFFKETRVSTEIIAQAKLDVLVSYENDWHLPLLPTLGPSSSQGISWEWNGPVLCMLLWTSWENVNNQGMIKQNEPLRHVHPLVLKEPVFCSYKQHLFYTQ